MRNLLAAMLAFTLVGGCAKLAPSPLPPPPPPPPPPVYAPPPETAPAPPNNAATTSPARAVIVREFLVSGAQGQAFSQQTGTDMKAVVLLTEQNRGRNKHVCGAFTRLPTGQAAAEAVPDAKRIPTFWLLRSDVADRTDCGKLLDAYNYDAAAALLQVYGRADSKGPVLLVADNREGAEQRFVFVDLSKASENQIKATVPGWFGVMERNGMRDISLRSASIASVLGGLLCNTGQQVVADYVPAGADATNPATFGYDSAARAWKRPSLFKVGAILFGGPFVQAGCELLGAV